MAVTTPDELLEHRTDLISKARTHIYNRLAALHDPAWLRVLAVMEGRDAE